MQQWRPENAAMTFDEVSLERSKAFVQALQELKNLRPQLYSAAEYCEKSYLHSEQKQAITANSTNQVLNNLQLYSKTVTTCLGRVLDNLKEYAVQALVNAVDHLGTVACKLTDHAERQASDISTVELKISCLSQQLHSCQTFSDNEGLRQQQLFPATTRHKHHYTFPSSFSKRIETSSKQHKDNTLNHVQARPSFQISGIPAPNTLSRHLSSENSAPSRHSHTTLRFEDSKASHVKCDSEEDSAAPIPLSSYLQAARGHPLPDVASRIKEPFESGKSSAGFKAFEHSGRRAITQPPRSKSILSAFFPRNKTLETKRVPVS